MRRHRVLVLCALLAGSASAGELGGAPEISAPKLVEPLGGGAAAPPEAPPAGMPELAVPAVPIVSPAAAVPAAAAPAAVQYRSSAGQDRASSEQAKASADARFDNLAAPAQDGPAALPPSGPDGGPRLTPRNAREKISEHYHFRRLWIENMHWYLVTHIKGMWPRYRAKIIVAQAKGATLPMSSHRRFFSYMRIMGQTGRFYVLGFAPRDDKSVLQEARETFRKYFNAIEIGPEEQAAFERFLERATSYNAAKRNNTNLRKHIRDAMLQAAVTPVEQVGEYLESLLREDAQRQTDAYQQSGGQKKTLEAFRQAALDTIAEERPAAKDRVVGVVLLGSFASGGATSRSDLDVEVLTANGHASRVPAFKKRLTDRWRAAGQHKDHPVSVKDFPDPPSRAVIDRIHYFDYVVISPFPQIVRSLARKPGQAPAFTADEKMNFWSPCLRRLQYLTVYWTTVWSDLKALFA